MANFYFLQDISCRDSNKHAHSLTRSIRFEFTNLTGAFYGKNGDIKSAAEKTVWREPQMGIPKRIFHGGHEVSGTLQWKSEGQCTLPHAQAGGWAVLPSEPSSS